jgi:hypothetical protein
MHLLLLLASLLLIALLLFLVTLVNTLYSRHLTVAVNPAIVYVYAAIGAPFVSFFLASLLLPMSLYAVAGISVVSSTRAVADTRKNICCCKVLFQVSFKTKRFCIAFYESNR